MEEAHRFGIMNTKEDLSIYEFEEKPANPKSYMASMGVYVFTWEVVKRYLDVDADNPDSANAFGKNIIPAMLNGGQKMFAYPFQGYWKDVGPIARLWDAHMELLHSKPCLLYTSCWCRVIRTPLASALLSTRIGSVYWLLLPTTQGYLIG